MAVCDGEKDSCTPTDAMHTTNSIRPPMCNVHCDAQSVWSVLKRACLSLITHRINFHFICLSIHKYVCVRMHFMLKI